LFLITSKVPYHLPMISSHVFKIKNNIIGEYFLTKNYKLIIFCNIFYNKFELISLKQLNKYILKSFSTHWMRVAFKGKGFRLRKFKHVNKITLNFGHSHWTKLALYPTKYFFKKIKRQNYICFVRSYYQLKFFKIHIKTIKQLNVYTKRGLRLKKQFIRRRFGKISQVVSSLH
jgi:hypothetical protein